MVRITSRVLAKEKHIYDCWCWKCDHDIDLWRGGQYSDNGCIYVHCTTFFKFVEKVTVIAK